MNPLESLNSPDIDIAQLAVNLLLKEREFLEIEELLKHTVYRVDTFDRNYIVLKER